MSSSLIKLYVFDLKCAMVITLFPVAGSVFTILQISTVFAFLPTLSMLLINLSTAGVVLSKKTVGSLKPFPLIIHLLVFFLIASEISIGLIFLPDFLIFLSLFSSFLLISLNSSFPLHFKSSNTLACLFSSFLTSRSHFWVSFLSRLRSSLLRFSSSLRYSFSRINSSAFSRFSRSFCLSR